MQNCEKKRVKKEEYVVSEEIQMLKFKLHTPTLTFIVIYRIVLFYDLIHICLLVKFCIVH